MRLCLASVVLAVLFTAMEMSAFADAAAEKAARRFATGGDVTSFHYTDAAGVGYTAFVHTFTNTAEAAEFRNKSGKTLPVRMLAVGGGGAGMDGLKNYTPGGTNRRAGGGGGGGGGVTETNALLSVDDIWTIRVGAGGMLPSSHAQNAARIAAGASCVSNGVAEVVSVPGGGAGGSRELRPTVGAAGGGGAGGSQQQAAGTNGCYTSSTFLAEGIANGGSGGNGEHRYVSGSYGGGGGGAGANGSGRNGGEGLVSNITGEDVVYGSGGGGGGHSRVAADASGYSAGGVGGTNAGIGGTVVKWDISADGSTTNITLKAAESPVPNTGAGGAGGISYCGGANVADYSGTTVHYGTDGADGVVIIRYDIPDTPCVGGDVVTVMTNGFRVTYIHKFTNTTEAVIFKPSVAFDGTSVRLLAVGGGGAGMDGLKNYNTTNRRAGGGGGGGGGVTETNALLSVGDVWTIRVGAGGMLPSSHAQDAARVAAGASCVSNGVAEVVSVPGGGAGGSRVLYPTVGAAGGGGAGASDQYATGTNGCYTSSTFLAEGIVNGGFGGSGGTGNAAMYGGGGGGASANGSGETGGEGLVSNITGEDVVYGSGGGGGGHSKVSPGTPGRHAGGAGGTNAGIGGTVEPWSISADGSTTNIVLHVAEPPVPNTGAGGAGGISYSGGANVADYSSTTVHYGTDGADGVVIIRYEADLPHPKGFMVIFH